MKKAFKIPLVIFVSVLVLALIYVAYVLIDYNRLDDNLALKVENNKECIVQTGKDYRIVTYNIGFGAYESDFGFFMDGGTRAWAWSRDRLNANLKNISKFLSSTQADILFVQEVDIDSTRSYHFDERNYLTSQLSDYAFSFSQNYDSPFLIYPFTQPIGKSVSGLMTFTKFKQTNVIRRSLPLEKSIMGVIDLDRCYSVTRIPVENGKELVLYNFHLSAYTSDGSISTQQLEMLLTQMQEEYEKGNYCIAGGDFNKDVLGGGSELFGVTNSDYNWAKPIPDYLFEGLNLTKIGAYNSENPVASCRNADGPYNVEQYQVTVDGFIVSDNITVTETHVINLGFKYSDHNPVEMLFSLNTNN